MTAPDDASAPRHRSILVVLLAALLLLGLAVPGPAPAQPHPYDPEPALSQEQGPHLAVAHPLPIVDAPGQTRLSRPAWRTVAFSAATPAELDRAQVAAAARAPPQCHIGCMLVAPSGRAARCRITDGPGLPLAAW